MEDKEFNQQIIEYYKATENAYKDGWDLDNSLSLHYGYCDEKTKTFPESLIRMNEIMMEAVDIRSTDKVLDAGCGIGGSCIFLAERLGCNVIGISLSEKQIERAKLIANQKGLSDKTAFEVMDFSFTLFPDQSFDVVWACESVCHAENKETFIKEAFRLLKPNGRLVVVDGFVSNFSNNQKPLIRNWLDGWQVNFLESPGRFVDFMKNTGFINIKYTDISRYTIQSSKRLYILYFLALLYRGYKIITLSDRSTEIQRKSTKACKFQYIALKNGLWHHGMFVGIKATYEKDKG